MSKEIKQLIKDAKQAYGEKQFKIAEEKCVVCFVTLHCYCSMGLRVFVFDVSVGSSKSRSKELCGQFVAGSHLQRK